MIRTLSHVVDGAECSILIPSSVEDLGGFERFLSRGDRILAIDTETTGLDIFSPSHEIRLFQIGNGREAWVLDARIFGDAIRAALAADRTFVAHNAPYDLLVLDHHLGVDLEMLAPKTLDTYVMAHLLDPRQKSEGGTGLKLKQLAEVYVDATAPDTTGDLTAVFRSLGFTKETGWRHIPLDHETYLRYAGLDVILAHRLAAELGPLVKETGLGHLSTFEHHFQMLLAILQRRGMLVDVPFTERLRDVLEAEAIEFANVARLYGVENVNSTKQVGEALVGMGEAMRERTKNGAIKVGKENLLPLADLDNDWIRIEAREPNVLADAVLRSKRAGKWRTSYAQAFLDLRDASDRLHPFIGSLQARTARMSVSRPPLQQLPSREWRVRRCFVADPGQLIIASDYSQVEMRVLAALSKDPAMTEAILSGVDLHDWTATRIYGDGFTKSQRKTVKGVGFGKVYGGGATTIARQTGAPMDAVKEAIAAYDSTFPGIKAFGRRLQKSAEYGKKEVITPSGRHLPLDRDRTYAATNYVVQSTARDLLAQAIVNLFDQGLGDHLLLPIHDEILAQAPENDAKDVVLEIGRVMESTFFGIPITADPEVYGRSWGHGYGADE